MSSVHFYVESQDEQLTPGQYGYWLVKWSDDAANLSVDDLKAPGYRVAPIVKKILDGNYFAFMHYLTIYMASYFSYAAIILEVQETTAKEIRRGLDDGLKQLRKDNKPLDSSLMTYLGQAFDVYVRSISEDYLSNNNSEVYDPDINSLAKRHVAMMAEFYGGMTEIDRLKLGSFAADIPVGAWKYMKENLQLKLQQ